MDDRFNRIALCKDCDGLTITVAQPLPVNGFRFDGPDGPIVESGPTTIYVTRLDAEPCPNLTAEEPRRG